MLTPIVRIDVSGKDPSVCIIDLSEPPFRRKKTISKKVLNEIIGLLFSYTIT